MAGPGAGSTSPGLLDRLFPGPALLRALGKLARPHDAVLGQGVGLDGWVDAEAYEGSTTLEGLLVYRFDAPLFFANVGWFRQRLRRAMDRNAGAERWVVIDFEGIGSVDATAVEGLCALVDELHEGGVVVGTAGPTTSSSARCNVAG